MLGLAWFSLAGQGPARYGMAWQGMARQGFV